jgi:hypothetical protein
VHTGLLIAIHTEASEPGLSKIKADTGTGRKFPFSEEELARNAISRDGKERREALIIKAELFNWSAFEAHFYPLRIISLRNNFY